MPGSRGLGSGFRVPARGRVLGSEAQPEAGFWFRDYSCTTAGNPTEFTVMCQDTLKCEVEVPRRRTTGLTPAPMAMRCRAMPTPRRLASPSAKAKHEASGSLGKSIRTQTSAFLRWLEFAFLAAAGTRPIPMSGLGHASNLDTAVCVLLAPSSGLNVYAVYNRFEFLR